jgi:hypothetical protein
LENYVVSFRWRTVERWRVINHGMIVTLSSYIVAFVVSLSFIFVLKVPDLWDLAYYRVIIAPNFISKGIL